MAEFSIDNNGYLDSVRAVSRRNNVAGVQSEDDTDFGDQLVEKIRKENIDKVNEVVNQALNLVNFPFSRNNTGLVGDLVSSGSINGILGGASPISNLFGATGGLPNLQLFKPDPEEGTDEFAAGDEFLI
ncbi:MAG: hypothetical protein AAB066_01970 [Candidatus Margulisiibacteriota bacterium]